MNCIHCGCEIKENQKFCTKCGTKINYDKNSNKKLFLISGAVIFILFIFGLLTTLFLNNIEYFMPIRVEWADLNKTPAETLAKIDELQAKYFEIIKRNNLLLQGGTPTEDRIELDRLFDYVKRKIDKNNYYLKKYKLIEEEYAINPGMTQGDMNDFAREHYRVVDDLLNETYRAVKAKIPPEDFKDLIKSELRWLKEVQDYYKVFQAWGYGSMGPMVNFGYECDMRNFRTLLLMLYL